MEIIEKYFRVQLYLSKQIQFRHLKLSYNELYTGYGCLDACHELHLIILTVVQKLFIQLHYTIFLHLKYSFHVK